MSYIPIDQVKQFLPQLQEANAKLEGDLKDPNVQARYNIEHIDEEAKELIEMVCVITTLECSPKQTLQFLSELGCL